MKDELTPKQQTENDEDGSVVIDALEFMSMMEEAKKHTDENGVIKEWGYRMPLTYRSSRDFGKIT